MNCFGRKFRVEIFGESHGLEIGVLIDGIHPGISLSIDDFTRDIERRRSFKAGTTSRKENDRPEIRSGLFQGKTTGAPMLICFRNSDVRSQDYNSIDVLPRPGHADLTAIQKFQGFNDFRGGGHFSGRVTLGLVAAGVVAKKMFPNIKFSSKILSIGNCIETNQINDLITKTQDEGDSLGGIVECKISNLNPGIGEPFFDSVESIISHLIFSIPGVRGIEFGLGFKAAFITGSEHNDEILNKSGKTKTNNQGGINGGITNGNNIVFRVAFKPTSSISVKQKTVNLITGEQEEIHVKGRHDTCFVLRTPVIVEAAAAVAIADLACINVL